MVGGARLARPQDAYAPRRTPTDVVRWQADCRTRHTWNVLREPPANGWPATLRATYEAIAEVTGAEVIVDSSKFASDAALLTHLRRDHAPRTCT